MIEKVFNALPDSVSNLARKCYMSETTCRKYIRLLEEQKRIYIKSWKLVGCTYIPIYAQGSKASKQRTPLSNKERRQRYMNKLRSDDHRYDRYLAKKRVIHITRDPLVAALFGANNEQKHITQF